MNTPPLAPAVALYSVARRFRKWLWLLAVFPLVAFGADERFTIRCEVTISASDNYLYERRFDDGFLTERDTRTDSLTYVGGSEEKIRIVDRDWTHEDESSWYQVSGGGEYTHTWYRRDEPPETQTVSWGYATDPSWDDPLTSDMTVNLDTKFVDCAFTPTVEFPLVVTGSGGQGGASVAALTVMLYSPLLFLEPIELPTNTTSYTVTRTYSTNLVTPYTGTGETGQTTANYRCTVSIQRNPAELEAVILTNLPAPLPPPMACYGDWLPKAGANEDEIGSTVMVRVIIRQKGSTDTEPVGNAKAKFKCRLNDVTREPGICLNYPPKESAVASPDLLFHAADNLLPYAGGLAAETVRDDLNEITLGIDSFDFGAYGTLDVTAEIEGVGEVKAFVEGQPGQFYLRFPVDDNQNRIGDVWEKQENIFGWNLAPDWDQDSTPSGQRSQGDGLSVYEEYRGFMVKGVHERLDPRWKDLFIYDPDGLALFTLTAGADVMNIYTASQVFPHLIEVEEWTGTGSAAQQKRIVNFNTSGLGHVVDQHGLDLELERGWMSTDYGEGSFGKIYEDEFAGNLPSNGNWDANQMGGVPATTYYEETGAGDRPRDVKYILVRPEAIKQNIWNEVRYHTRSLPLFAPLSDPALPADQKKTLKRLLDQATDQYIAEHPQEALRAYRKWVGLIVTHELGHGMGTDDHQPDMFGGDRACVMRYLKTDDLARDPNDRFGLGRRVWPTGFCTSADACKLRIQVSDKEGMGAAAVVGQPAGLEGGGGGDDPLAPAGYAEVVARAEPLELSIGLAWAPAYAGDPLDVFVRMDAALYRQTQVLQLGGGTGMIGGMTNLPSLAATWADGVTLELARLGTGGLREVVLASNAWTAFRRTGSNDVWGGLVLPVVTAEWFVPATNVSLTAGSYELTARWNGEGLTETELMPTSGFVLAPVFAFAVVDPTNDVMQADHLGRLAIAARAAGHLEAARSLATEALQMDGSGAGLERLGSYRLLANVAFAQGDLFGAFQALTALAQGSTSRDVAYNTLRDQSALRPALNLVPPQSGQPWKLLITAWPDQFVEAQQSADLTTWQTVQSARVGADGFLEITTISANDPGRHFYRVVWQP